MYEQHFGLTKRPFDGLAEGADVFVGPQTATLVRRAKVVFANPDSVICVSGPVGSGKTTLVGRALSALGRQHTIIRIGRIRLGPDEVLDFLLRELGLKQMPAGTIQKITVFRSVLEKLESNDIRLFIIVEDAARLGNVALQELEALTATDSGVSEGANLVLMAEDSLKAPLEAPGLKRLKQRARLHYGLKPMTPPEVRGYLTHALRQAGGNISGIITDEAILAVHALSEGIPRVINNLADAALEAAAEHGLQRLDTKTLRQVAVDEFGIELDALPSGGDEVPEAVVAQPVAAEDAAPASSRPDAVEASRFDTELADTADDTSASDTPVLIQDTLPEVAAIESGEYPIPDLIQDTLPDLEVLAPETSDTAERNESAPSTGVNKDSGSPPDLGQPEGIEATLRELELPDEQPADDDEAIPTLFDSSAGMATPVPAAADRHEDFAPPQPDEVPAWDRDPTLAELKPDLEALERAMAVAHGTSADAQAPQQEPAPELPEKEPEITLDESIRRKIDFAEAALDDSQTLEQDELGDGVNVNLDIDADVEAAVEKSKTTEIVDDFGPAPSKADAELERIAAELAKAKSIEDVDDRLAETLFGEEFSLMAAEVAANAPTLEEATEEPVASPLSDATGEPANDTPAFDEGAVELALAESGPSDEIPVEQTDGVNGDGPDLERKFKDLYDGEALEVSMETSPTGLNLSASQRLATVRALNAGGAEEPESTHTSRPPECKAPRAPESIEDQINTSITQTLKGLNSAKIKEMQEAEAKSEEKKSGLFGRFRRSSST